MSAEELRRVVHDLRVHHVELFDMAPVGYMTLDADGLIVQANLTVASMLGVERATLIGQPFDLLVAVEHRDDARLVRRRLAEQGGVNVQEMVMIRPTGARFWARLESSVTTTAMADPAVRLVLSDISAAKSLALLRELEWAMLERCARGVALPSLLESLVVGYESMTPGMRGSVLLLDLSGRHLRIGAAPHLPVEYCDAIDGIEIGPAVGSCGTAAHTGQTVVAADIATDPRWVDFCDLALAHGLRSCWSVPITGASGRVLGTFAFYFDVPRAATADDLAAIEHGANLAGVAIERDRTAAELAESIQRFEGAFEHSAIAMSLAAPDGTRIRVNARRAAMLGYTEAETLAMRFEDSCHPDDQATAWVLWDRLLAGEIDSYENPLRFIHKDGHTVWTSVANAAVRDAGGNILYVVSQVVDMTSQTLVERELRRSEEQLSITLQSIGDAVITTDAAGLITRMNTTAERLTGWSLADAAGLRLSQVYQIVDARTLLPAVDSAALVMDSGRVVSLADHSMLIARDGQEFRISDSAAPIRDTTGVIVGVVVVFRDVTDVYLLHQSLEASAGVLERTGAIAKIGGWELDLRTGQGVWTPELFRILDVVPPVIPPLEEGFDRFFPPDSRVMVQTAMQAGMSDGTPWDLEVSMLTGSGQPIWIRLTGAATFDDGQPVRLSGVFHDITQRRAAEEALSRSEARLRQAVKMESVGLLAGGVAHDFNNMLGVILGHAEVAMGEPDAVGRVHAHLGAICQAAERSAALTRQLLAYSRQQPVVPEVVDLNHAVDAVLGILQRLVGDDVSVLVQRGADLWPVEIDPSQIDQILTNLCVNARDAIAGVGQIVIETANCVLDAAFCASRLDAEPGEYVRLTVRDTGMGIDPETLPRLFEPFFTTKAVGSGTGLGLATVYGVVTQNLGFVDVSSDPGQGATFLVYLPRRVSGDATSPGLTDQLAAVPAGGSGMVLVVEDEPELLELVTEVLEREGYVVLAAPGAADAIRLAQAHVDEIRLVLTDVIMPEMSGHDLTERLLSLGLHADYLYMSGYTGGILGERGLVGLEAAFIQKPFTIAALVAKVGAVLQG